MTPDNDVPLDIELGKVFTPTSPVNENSLFAGRIGQLNRVIDTFNQRGQHAALYGERGVGKTSLANIIANRLVHPGSSFLIPRINCDTQDVFMDMWKKAFIQMNRAASKFHDAASKAEIQKILNPYINEGFDYINPGDVCNVLYDISQCAGVAVIFDEFDRIETSPTRQVVADCIKALSDQDINATLVLVGVADSIDELVAEHQSNCKEH